MPTANPLKPVPIIPRETQPIRNQEETRIIQQKTGPVIQVIRQTLQTHCVQKGKKKKTPTELKTETAPTNNYPRQVGSCEAKINHRGYNYFNFTHLP